MSQIANRRRFLQLSLAATLCSGAGLPALTRIARAAGFAELNHPVLANLMLNGGPDMRHLIAPPYSANPNDFGYHYWRARIRSQGITDTAAAMEARWQNDYLHETSADGQSFGILGRCQWLRDMWAAGKVAFVCNVLPDSSRDHDQAIRNMEMGNRSAGKYTFGSGWGGRLANAAQGNVVALTQSPRRFSFGPNPAMPLDLSAIDNRRLIPAGDMRDIGLPENDPNQTWFGPREHLIRGLKHYYAERRATVPSSSVYHQFFEHERKLRQFGAVIDARLQEVPVPASIDYLFQRAQDGMYRWDLALSIRNLYDALACSDVLQMHVASLEFNGWDTHDRQREEMEPNLEMMFGANGGFAALYTNLPASARANTVLLIGGEFGRQIHDNGGAGTDHGEGTTLILIGDAVRGGVYGTLFPESEIARIDQPSADIVGLTAIERVFGRICDWAAPGSSTTVFPGGSNAPIEPGVDLGPLFA